MRPPFYRHCVKHEGAEVSNSIGPDKRETLWCAEGHQVSRWSVVDSSGKRLAIGHLHKSPQIIDPEMLQNLDENPLFSIKVWELPERLCQRGHSDWYISVDDRYRCKQCKRDRDEASRARSRERYHSKAKRSGKITKRRTGSKEESRRAYNEKRKVRYKTDKKFREARRAACRKYWNKYRAKNKEAK